MPAGNPAPMGHKTNPTLMIFRKEFREIFRDRRTIMSVVVGPLIITPALFALMGLAITKQIDKQKSQTYSVGVIGLPKDSAMMATLKKMPNLRLEPMKDAAEANDKIKARAVNAAAIFPPDTQEAIDSNRSVKINVLSDSGEESSQMAAGMLKETFGRIGQAEVAKRLQAKGLDAGFAKPIQIAEQSIPSSGGGAMLFLSRMLPYLLIFSAFGGGIYAAFDQVAGEKERGTLETLLVSPASRRDIVLGKFGAVVAVCLVSSLLSIVGLVIPFVSGLKAFEWLAKGGLALSPVTVSVVLLAILPIAVLFAGLLLAVSTIARNQKEAQTSLGSLFPIITIPAMLSLFMDANVSNSVALIPILNASIIIKQALNGSYNSTFIAIALTASIVYAGIALGLATRLFQKESVLIKA